MKKKKSSDGGGANWMDTYGDMVTLLLCFFVLLYSMSTIDQQKWLEIVRSFNPDAIPEITVIEQGNEGNILDPVGGPSTQDQQEEIEESIDDLFEQLQQYIEEQNAQDNISATRGDGYVFLSLNDAVFFDGDSFVLREDGKAVLMDVGTIIGRASDAIDEFRVLGHTAQATPDTQNDPMPDRMLSTNRANAVLVYLQENVPDFDLDPARMLSVGYGQWRPISSNDTGPERAKNRRVEFIITGKNVEDSMNDTIVQYYTMSDSPPPESFGPDMPASAEAEPTSAEVTETSATFEED